MEEVVSYRSANIARVEASRREGRQGASRVEVGEEVVSYRRDLARVETSFREAC